MTQSEAGPGKHHLYLLFTPELCAADPWETLDQALQGGVDLVQWRTPDRRDAEGAARCIEVCHRHDVPVVINDHVDLTIELGAAGAHVGQNDMPAAEARALLGPDRWLGVSTHSQEEIAGALRDSADHIGFGPMFATRTKGYSDGQPDGALRAAVEQAGIPVFAIGGITPDNVHRVRDGGCERAAISGAILGAADPARAATLLRAGLRC